MLVTASWVLGVVLVGVGLVAAGRRVPSPSSRAGLTVLGVAVVLLPVTVAGTFLLSAGDPVAEPDRSLVGARVVEGSLELWIGPGCETVDEVLVTLDAAASPDDRRIVLPGAAVPERLTIRPDRLPEGAVDHGAGPIDLAAQQAVTVRARRAAGVRLGPVRSDADASDGRFWFGDRLGWLTPTAAERRAARDGLSTVCAR